ncbi:PepSY domain-containing protein [Mariprofundus erugo]|uniref:PepSY domain-containing protein n=1 Tax=Mariprofundus erugo TaxID=2528639 RepID=A0A5R9GV70_9PROT|nr:PepSY domain-containing protein [Mariprofundus erugo]TLS67912.1 PepSY domain-containing protein [Mariprofundus erugo]TLS76675.1 PepSY domain-containing protein [Mariprofundus erugo]
MHMLHKAVLAMVVVISTTAMALADDADRVRQLRSTDSIMPLATIVKMVEARYPGKLLDVELEEEHGKVVYEIEFLGDDHQVHHLEIDARSGSFIDNGDH